MQTSAPPMHVPMSAELRDVVMAWSKSVSRDALTEINLTLTVVHRLVRLQHAAAMGSFKSALSNAMMATSTMRIAVASTAQMHNAAMVSSTETLRHVMTET